MSELREREFGRDFFQESRPAGRSREVHLVMSEIGRARQGMADRPQSPADRLARRVAHQEGAPTRTAIAGHRDEPANIVQSRLRLAIDHLAAPRKFGGRLLRRKAMFLRGLHDFNDSRVVPGEKWREVTDWQAEPALDRRFPCLFAAGRVWVIPQAAQGPA